jgi:hypothetical protein
LISVLLLLDLRDSKDGRVNRAFLDHRANVANKEFRASAESRAQLESVDRRVNRVKMEKTGSKALKEFREKLDEMALMALREFRGQ